MDNILIAEGTLHDGIEYTLHVMPEFDTGSLTMVTPDGMTVTVSGRIIYECMTEEGINAHADRHLR